MQAGKQKTFHFLLCLLCSGALLTGCSDSDNDDDVGANNDDDIITIDAAAGGFPPTAGDPANKYTYYDLINGTVVELTDASSENSTAWHVAFKRTSTLLNGGVSGPGSVSGTLADAQQDFYDSSDDPVTSMFEAATAANEKASFDAITDDTDLTYINDSNNPYISGEGEIITSGANTGSMDFSWYIYNPSNHAVSANPNTYWIVRSAGGDSYVKFRVTDLTLSGFSLTDLSIEMAIQASGETAFSSTLINFVADFSTASSICYDIDTTSAVDCDSSAGDWDIRFDSDLNIWTNSGIYGSSSNGGAFPDFEYIAGTSNNSGEAPPAYFTDTAGGVFKDTDWYAYSLQGNHKIWPNYRVYIIDTGAGKYKLQLSGFYDEAGTSGHISFRYSLLGS